MLVERCLFLLTLVVGELELCFQCVCDNNEQKCEKSHANKNFVMCVYPMTKGKTEKCFVLFL